MLDAFAALLLLASTTTSLQCAPIKEVMMFAKSQPLFLASEALDGERRQIVLGFFRLIPPGSPHDWPIVIIIQNRDGSGKIFVGEDDKVCDSASIGASVWQRLMEGISGHSI